MKLRLATVDDIPLMHRIRMAVRENRLVHTVVGHEDYVAAITIDGRGWVVEANGAVPAFAVARHSNANVWALFVEPGFEGRGFGRALHDAMLAYFREQGCCRVWLTTSPATRAERFYRVAGWRFAGVMADEVRFEMDLP